MMLNDDIVNEFKLKAMTESVWPLDDRSVSCEPRSEPKSTQSKDFLAKHRKLQEAQRLKENPQLMITDGTTGGDAVYIYKIVFRRNSVTKP